MGLDRGLVGRLDDRTCVRPVFALDAARAPAVASVGLRVHPVAFIAWVLGLIVQTTDGGHGGR